MARGSRVGFLAFVAVVSGVGIGAAVAFKPLYGVAGVAVVTLGLVALWRPAIGAYVLVVLVPVTSGFRRGFPIPHLGISEALVAFLGVIILLTAARRQAVPWSGLDWLLLAWAAGWLLVGGIDVVRFHEPLGLRAFEALLGPFQFLLLYRAVLTALPLRHQRRRALALFLWSSVPVSLLAILQQFRLHVVQRFVAYLTGGSVFNTYAYHYFARATGPFSHWTPLAGYLFVVLLAGLALILEGDPPLPRRRLLLILLLAATALLLTAELSAMFGTVVGAVILGAWYGRLRQVVRWLGVGAIVLGVAFGSYFGHRLHDEFTRTAGSARSSLVPQTIEYRLQIWTGQYFPAIGEHPVAGWGAELPSNINWQYTESQYVTLLMEGGVLVLGAYGGLMWCLFARSRRLGRRSRAPTPPNEGRAMARSLAVMVALLVPMNAVFPYFSSGGLAQPFWVVAAILAAASSSGRLSHAVGPAAATEALPGTAVAAAVAAPSGV
ncbi:MAG: O-antigen ligase family protein [Acidimicrobiales bacterium]